MTTKTAFQRTLGRATLQVSAMGLGCWAIGGPWTLDGGPAGWSQVDDAESLRAIHCGLERGVNLFDTAANYGAGHSERLLGQAFKGRRDKVILASKALTCLSDAFEGCAYKPCKTLNSKPIKIKRAILCIVMIVFILSSVRYKNRLFIIY